MTYLCLLYTQHAWCTLRPILSARASEHIVSWRSQNNNWFLGMTWLNPAQYQRGNPSVWYCPLHKTKCPEEVCNLPTHHEPSNVSVFTLVYGTIHIVSGTERLLEILATVRNSGLWAFNMFVLAISRVACFRAKITIRAPAKNQHHDSYSRVAILPTFCSEL